jgi:hypothetical protein
MVAAKSVLDATVEVLSKKRTASEHVAAVLEAVSKQTGVRVSLAQSFDSDFAANGYTIHHRPTDADRPYLLFDWGASEVSAREALVDLLGRSMTTMTWETYCAPDFLRGYQQRCQVAIHHLLTGRNGLQWDRCTNCREVPDGGK